MSDNIAKQIYEAATSLYQSIQSAGGSITTALDSMLNQFLPWPFKAGPATIIDTAENRTEFDSVIYTISEKYPNGQAVVLTADAVACAIFVAQNLGIEELRAGYEAISVIKGLKRRPTPKLDYPINDVPLGIIFAADSVLSIDQIAELVIEQNKSFSSMTWPDMVVVMSKGTVNYAVQFPGEPDFKGNLTLPNFKSSMIPPMYVHVIATGLGMFSINKMCSLLFPHLQVYSPGAKLPAMDSVLEGVSSLGITLGGYQFNLDTELVPAPKEQYIDRGYVPLTFRIEDQKKNLLSHIQFIHWQNGGVIRLVGKLPLEGILVFLGEKAKGAQIIKQSEATISSVLPIGQKEFIAFLDAFQRRSNMILVQEKPKGVLSKMMDEGTTSPFVARLMLGIMRLRDVVFRNDNDRMQFDKAYEVVVMTIINVRTTANEIRETLATHSRKVTDGEIARLIGGVIRIDESIDHKLRKQVEELLYGAVRVVKDGMPKLLATMNVDIGFLYQKERSFEKGIAELAKTHSDLTAYLQKVRTWSEPLILTRNDLHEGWLLPRIIYSENNGKISMAEPVVAGQPVSEFAGFVIDRVCCFVEDVSVYALQRAMPSGVSVTEIPISERKTESPERFQLTFTAGGLPIWAIMYYENKLAEH